MQREWDERAFPHRKRSAGYYVELLDRGRSFFFEEERPLLFGRRFAPFLSRLEKNFRRRKSDGNDELFNDNNDNSNNSNNTENFESQKMKAKPLSPLSKHRNKLQQKKHKQKLNQHAPAKKIRIKRGEFRLAGKGRVDRKRASGIEGRESEISSKTGECVDGKYLKSTVKTLSAGPDNALSAAATMQLAATQLAFIKSASYERELREFAILIGAVILCYKCSKDIISACTAIPLVERTAQFVFAHDRKYINVDKRLLTSGKPSQQFYRITGFQGHLKGNDSDTDDYGGRKKRKKQTNRSSKWLKSDRDSALVGVYFCFIIQQGTAQLYNILCPGLRFVNGE
ncbi:hypothetical protein WN51_06730 [Melipona quadrifasciata]|uniref:Uncharacterized protein n=1 Tax=Melipona quadrifasciata TaxID=166423 RepID=A0A0M8ZT36_9HYME|nr:hypothetical protein WN51_06730 [Melipona quadrifasciata]